jgi:hypothetical protein
VSGPSQPSSITPQLPLVLFPRGHGIPAPIVRTRPGWMWRLFLLAAAAWLVGFFWADLSTPLRR